MADTSPPEVIVIHSQSQYRCVVKTRTVLTSIPPSCRHAHVTALQLDGDHFSAVVLTLSRWQQQFLGSSNAINLDDNVICVCIVVIQGCAPLSHAPRAFCGEFNLCVCAGDKDIYFCSQKCLPPPLSGYFKPISHWPAGITLQLY